ncbi:WD repeat-containing protein 97-like [Tubulanus polymorphus]|uniref:WD repeat-containing protein 97-like n=1 Tax=Tubulanus polymorphus TaxID=672921 RepID=UPI003DA49390
MADRVEELLHQHGLLVDRPKRPNTINGVPRSVYYWGLLRNSVRNTIDAVKQTDFKEKLVAHGIRYKRRVEIDDDETVQSVVFNNVFKEHIVIDSQYVRVFHEDGRKKDLVVPDSKINRINFASQINMYVGWNYKQDDLYLMSNNFTIVSESKHATRITATVYNENTGEFISSGYGCFTVWAFRYGARHLLPRKSTQEGLTSKDQFEFMVVEETASHGQKCFAICGTTVSVFNIFECKLLSRHKDLHVRPISAAMFFNPLKFLITGAKDGSIKVWSETFHLVMVFVGHSHRISALSVYPYGPYIMSASFDHTLRVWSLETVDEIDRVDTEEPVNGLGTELLQDGFFTYSRNYVELWNVYHLHTVHSNIGYKVPILKQTDHPSFPIRTVLLCRDSSVRITCPTSGNIITTMLNDPKNLLIDAAYSIEENVLFAVFENGNIIKCSTLENPCTIEKVWKCKDPTKACNYLLVYEYVVDAMMEGDFWSGMKRAIQTQSIAIASTQQQKKSNKTLLLGGRKDGYICVFNWSTGKVDFEIEAHGVKGVLSMVANSRMDQLISAGKDNIIKIWRLYPYAQEALAPLMSFFCAHTPIQMTVLKEKLLVAFQEHSSATYSVVMYNLNTKDRSDHSPDDDHTDTITGISVCSRLKLFATSSLDGTIRIWDDHNQLVRMLKLNAVPLSVSFCSQRGDLVVGIDKHLHKINYQSYLPRVYILKMVCMKFDASIAQDALPYEEEVCRKLSQVDLKRLKGARAAFRFENFMDVLSAEETKEVMGEKILKEKMFAILDQREKEIVLIRDGELHAKHKPKSTKKTKRDAFDKYLKIFYDRPKIELPPDDDDQIEEQMKILSGEKPAVSKDEKRDVYRPEIGATGFFPPANLAKRQPALVGAPCAAAESAAPDKPLRAAYYPTMPDGYVPNSILTRLLWPPEQKAAIKKAYKPPKLNREQLELIKKLKKPVSSVDIQREATRSTSNWNDRTMIMDWSDDEESKKEVEEDDDEEFTLSRRPSGKDSARPDGEESPPSLMDKMKGILEKPPSPKLDAPSPEPLPAPTPETPVDDSVKKQSTPPSRRPTSQLTPQRPTQPKPLKPRDSGVIKPLKPIVKHVSRPPPKSPQAPPTPKPRTPTPPPTPLPDFISQFKGVDWFEKYFPNCNERTMPKPWSTEAFITMLLRVMKIAELQIKISVMNAILTIHHQEGVTNNEAVTKTVIGLLNSSENPMTCLDALQKEFILTALRLTCAMRSYTKDLYAEVMCQYMDGDKDVRSTSVDMLKMCGMIDPHNYFTKELDSWDTWGLDDKNRKRTLIAMCSDWLEKWMTQFKIHLNDAIEKLKKGQGLHGKVVPPTAQTGKLSSPSKSILKRNDETVDSNKQKAVTVTFDAVPDASLIESATYIEAINYFCEFQLQKELERLRSGGTDKEKKPSLPKNTVLVLPKVDGRTALVRLGETHTSQCRPHRETSYAVDYRSLPMTSRGRQPAIGQLDGFPNCIVLPLKTVAMNPFPSPIDYYEMREPVLITLKMAPKYFIPSQSFIPPDVAPSLS